MIPEIIYCADGNEDFASIAIEAGFTYGAQPLKKFYRPIDFADIDPNNIPPKEAYIAALARHKPRLATVADWATWEQLPEVLEWAEEAAAHVKTIIIIPKVVGGVASLPKVIGGRPVRLGFSYPSGHGRAAWDILYEMIGWPHGIHILGGLPQAAWYLARGQFKAPRCKARPPDLLTSALDIRSADSNQMVFLATKGIFIDYDAGFGFRHLTVRQADKKKWGDGSNRAGTPNEAFRRSCKTIKNLWRGDG